MTDLDAYISLGRRLHSVDDTTVSAAAEANPWFRPQDIRLALSTAADSMLSEAKLRKWLDAYPAIPVSTPKNVLIIMAGNIPAVGLQDLLCVTASGHRAIIKPSSRDTVLMSYIKDALDEAFEIEYYDTHTLPDAVIAMGGDNTVRLLDERFATLPRLLRGSRSSLAVLDGNETERDLELLGNDIVQYSGLGCRNVSLIFVPRDYDFDALCGVLSRADVSQGWGNSCRQSRAEKTLSAQPFVDAHTAILCEQCSFPPTIGTVNYCRYDSLSEVERWIEADDAKIQCIVSRCISHSRCVLPGHSQSPELTDYPDGRDVMQFLSSI